MPGPREVTGVCTLRGKDVVRILEHEFGVRYSLDGVYDLLERLGYSCLAPRPRHEKSDPAKQQEFRAAPPFCPHDSRCPEAARRQRPRVLHG